MSGGEFITPWCDIRWGSSPSVSKLTLKFIGILPNNNRLALNVQVFSSIYVMASVNLLSCAWAQLKLSGQWTTNSYHFINPTITFNEDESSIESPVFPYIYILSFTSFAPQKHVPLITIDKFPPWSSVDENQTSDLYLSSSFKITEVLYILPLPIDMGHTLSNCHISYMLFISNNFWQKIILIYLLQFKWY